RVFSVMVCAVLIGFLPASCSKPPEQGRQVKFYQSPMHPWITSDKPGNCTICGMALVPVFEGESEIKMEAGIVALNPQSLDVLAVTTVPVRRLGLTKSLRFSGTLEDDENIHRIIAAFYDGRVDEIYVEHVGQFVEKGQPLAAIYSPELLYVVREYQNAARSGDPAVARNSAQRLVQYGLSPEQVALLAKQPENIYTINLLAPISGTVLTREVFKGQYIKTGEPLFEMGNLARLWFHAEVYERDLPDIRIGQKAILRTPTVPGREFEGVVTFVDPNFDPRTRSTKVRIEVDNPLAEGEGHGLKRVLPHRAYAEAEITAQLGESLVVPRSAVLRDGRRAVVYVERSSDQYEQRSVRTGRVGDEGIEILEGLKEGERVVAHGNLMIDAEAQLRGSVTSPQTVPALDKPVGDDFFKQLAEVSEALAADDAVAVIKAGQKLPELAAAIPPTGEAEIDQLLARLKEIPKGPAGSDLKALRQSFLPWSTIGADLALALKRGGQAPGIAVFECPMAGDSFPGAPAKAKWVQSGSEIRNPYFGAEMLSCGTGVKP
ncbi:MAG TPA: efflux RND transporter periplasmic adaptor subunit, partial [Terrimicrobiaceae bacterium]|nr:efflux RND transporter periplasmic adaptor subunit [Terrimicrobiaceae bacterium]